MKLDDVKKLHQKKYRLQLGHYLVEGEHLILELQKAVSTSTIDENIDLYITLEHEDWASTLSAKFNLIVINQKQMSHISDTKTPQGMIACVPLSAFGQTAGANKHERCIYLHEIQDPGNLGTILRSLAWFGQFRLILSPNCVDPFNPKVVRASMGAIFHLPIELDVSLDELQSRFTKFAYLDMQGVVVNSPEFAHYDCYLFGNEARGVPREALSKCRADAFTISGSGNIDSLNLASAVNICAYQLSI